jgi:hypothetical protein
LFVTVFNIFQFNGCAKSFLAHIYRNQAFIHDVDGELFHVCATQFIYKFKVFVELLYVTIIVVRLHIVIAQDFVAI